jgi:hypothetical protein
MIKTLGVFNPGNHGRDRIQDKRSVYLTPDERTLRAASAEAAKADLTVGRTGTHENHKKNYYSV